MKNQGWEQSQCLGQRCPAFFTDEVADDHSSETDVVHMLDQGQEGLCIILSVEDKVTSHNLPYLSLWASHPRFEKVQDGPSYVRPNYQQNLLFGSRAAVVGWIPGVMAVLCSI